MISISLNAVNVFLSQGVQEFPYTSVARKNGMQKGLSPNAGDDAVSDRGDVRFPFGVLREYSLFGMDAVDQRPPTDQHQKKCNKIPFLQVVPDVSNYVRQIYWMTDKLVRSVCNQAS